MPAFIVNYDARTFYFVNVVLAYISMILMYSILRKLTSRKLLQLLGVTMLITSYHFYWLPTLAMAENLLVPLYLASIWLLLQKKSKKQLVLLGLTASAIYFTKFAYVPLSASIVLTAIGNSVIQAKNKSKKRWQRLGIDLCVLLAPLLITLPFSHNFLSSLTMLNNVITGIFSRPGVTATTESGASGYFSMATFPTYFLEYVKILLGKRARFLWDVRPWFSPLVAFMGIAGLSIASFKKKSRLAGVYIIVSTLAQISFMATFYAFDSRYIYSAFFGVLISSILSVDFILSQLQKRTNIKRYKKSIELIVIIIFAVVVFAPAAVRVKSQIVINLKYAETPWWYLSISEYNAFFANKREEQPQLITLSTPFMIDFFANNTYTVLPFDEQQDFSNQRDNVWGIPKDQTLMETYTQKLEAGENLYLADYGIQATGRFKSTFQNYTETFHIEKMQSGCFDLCNIYKVTLREE